MGKPIEAFIDLLSAAVNFRPVAFDRNFLMDTNALEQLINTAFDDAANVTADTQSSVNQLF